MVTTMRSAGMPQTSLKNDQIQVMQSFLKYSPNEKLPSISKNVWCRAVKPTLSRSGTRRHFCDVVMRFHGSVPLPRNMSLNWFMPAPVNSSVGSLAGTSESEAITLWPCCSNSFR